MNIILGAPRSHRNQGRHLLGDWSHGLHFLAMVLLVALVPHAALAEEIPDLTQGGKPGSTGRKPGPSIDWALGPLGVSGWGFSRIPNEGGSDKARQLLITRVEKDGPSSGLLSVGDVIIGTNGQNFSIDVRKALAQAINQAETEESDGRLNLLVWHPGKEDPQKGSVSEVVVRLAVLGTYSQTAPYNCPKTDRIIDQAVEYMKANKAKLLDGSVFGCVNGLGLMATGRQDVMPLVKEQAHRLILKPEEKLSIEQHVSMLSWNWAYRSILLAEYYLLTKDPAVLPTLDEYVTKLAMGQSGAGTWGHSIAARENTGHLHSHLGGYGELNQAGLACMMALVLGEKCGINNSEVKDAIKRGEDFFGYYIGKGAIPYGDDEPYNSFDDNGKSAQGAILFDLLNQRNGREFFSEMILGDAPRGRDIGHTGHYWSHLWGGIAAARAGSKGLQVFMKEMDHIFTLERQHDGRFVYQGNTGQRASTNAGFDKQGGLGMAKDTMDCTGARLLQLCFPRRILFLTGRETPTECHLSDKRIDEILNSGRLKIDHEARMALSEDAILQLLKDPLPAVRAIAIDTLYEQKVQITDKLLAMVDDENPYARYGAVEALGYVGNSSKAAVAKLIRIIETTPDTRLRIYAINALWNKDPNTGLTKAAGEAIPVLLKLTLRHFEDDPRRVTQFMTAKAIFNHYGLLKFHKIADEDRPLLVPAIKEWLSNQNALACELVTTSTYDMLTESERTQLWGDIYHSSRYASLSRVGRSGEVRTGGIELLAKNHVEEGMNLAVWFIRWQQHHGSKLRMPRLLKALESYGANAKPFLPYLEEHLAYYQAQAKRGGEEEPSSSEDGETEPSGKNNKSFREDPVKLIAETIEKIKNSTEAPQLTSIHDLINPAEIPYSKTAAKPTASAGEPITVRDEDGDGIATFLLDGSGSKDAEGVIQAYIWTVVSRKGKTEEIGRGAHPTVSLEPGTHTVTLTVYDTDGYAATDTVTVTVTK